jgi:hypothetical protein
LPLKTSFEERSLLFPDFREEVEFGVGRLDSRGVFEGSDDLDFFTLVFFGGIWLRYHPCIGGSGLGIQPEARNLGPPGSELHLIKNIKQSIWNKAISRIRIESAGRKTRLEDEGPP